MTPRKRLEAERDAFRQREADQQKEQAMQEHARERGVDLNRLREHVARIERRPLDAQRRQPSPGCPDCHGSGRIKADADVRPCHCTEPKVGTR